MSNTDTFYRALEKAFASTLSEEIIPGMLHNFANPLNGIMGRSKLLQRKLEINGRDSASAIEPDELYSKLFRDAELISRDTDKLAMLLRHVAEKFYTINKTSTQRINLSEIIDIELSFFDFYLDFKHNVTKKIDLTQDLPEITGSPADFSLGLWGLIRDTMLRLKDCDLRELHISTRHEDGHVQVHIANTGACIADTEWSDMVACLERETPCDSDFESNSTLMHSLLLLKKYHAQFQLDNGNGLHCLTVSIPVK